MDVCWFDTFIFHETNNKMSVDIDEKFDFRHLFFILQTRTNQILNLTEIN